MNTERSSNDALPDWTAQAKQLLDDNTDGLDAATLSRLNRARQGALAAARPRRLRPWFVPAGLASACAMLLAVAVVWHRPGTLDTDPLIGAETNATSGDAALTANDLDLVSSDDGIEFYQDLDFYAWLDAQASDTNG